MDAIEMLKSRRSVREFETTPGGKKRDRRHCGLRQAWRLLH